MSRVHGSSAGVHGRAGHVLTRGTYVGVPLIVVLILGLDLNNAYIKGDKILVEMN